VSDFLTQIPQEGFILPLVNPPSFIDSCDLGRHLNYIANSQATVRWHSSLCLQTAALHQMETCTLPISSENVYSLSYHSKVVFTGKNTGVHSAGEQGWENGKYSECVCVCVCEADTQSKLP